MTQRNMPAVDRLWEAVAPNLPTLTAEEQRAGIVLLRELARGEPVTAERLARAIGVTTAHAKALLERPGLKAFLYPDEEGRVVGYLGLAATPMHHRFALNGRALWTWCAGDSLFLPGVLNETAEVESRDPEGGELIHLTISPARVEAVEPEGVVVSMVNPDAPDFRSAALIMETACHYIFFFASCAAGERWVAKHPGTWLLSMDEAFEFGKRFRERLFATELARQPAGAV
ncbi:MAG: organomercurial lyase [Gemmatimonadales bacterium]